MFELFLTFVFVCLTGVLVGTLRSGLVARLGRRKKHPGRATLGVAVLIGGVLLFGLGVLMCSSFFKLDDPRFAGVGGFLLFLFLMILPAGCTLMGALMVPAYFNSYLEISQTSVTKSSMFGMVTRIDFKDIDWYGYGSRSRVLRIWGTDGTRISVNGGVFNTTELMSRLVEAEQPPPRQSLPKRVRRPERLSWPDWPQNPGV